MEKLRLCNLAKLESMSNGNSDFIIKMIHSFIYNTTTALDEFKSSIEAKDLMTLSKIAHKLKPSFDIMGVHSLKDQILRIEQYEREPFENDEMMAICNHFMEKSVEVIDELTEYNNNKEA
ncbi:Hpt domain-containing protein [Sediminitomix flava]|uniref:HPt (Histidine-containing phosphotransfer) domain-containing protein n=1 Tax=Sediminitomix flava TaxID=379075 RepID=A0A315ZC68_SEDFL|nr:Hpt domain-containing protein [Sediminitomix flava]PWJ42334.1 HPt (histidine-containing phosphotransfer) domain-containing protein [Sediminitomix flava]